MAMIRAVRPKDKVKRRKKDSALVKSILKVIFYLIMIMITGVTYLILSIIDYVKKRYSY